MEELAPADGPVPGAEAIAEAEQAANEVRNRIEGLGPVNAAAMEEYQEAQQRQEFLSVQRQDRTGVSRAIEPLKPRVRRTAADHDETPLLRHAPTR